MDCKLPVGIAKRLSMISTSIKDNGSGKRRRGSEDGGVSGDEKWERPRIAAGMSVIKLRLSGKEMGMVSQNQSHN